MRPGGALRVKTIDGMQDVQLNGLRFVYPPEAESFRAYRDMKAWLVGEKFIAVTGQTDRSGKTPMSLWIPSGEVLDADSVQEECLRRGLARLSPKAFGWPYENVEAAYAAEMEAREMRRGLWADDAFAIRPPDPDKLSQDMDSWQIVEGIVVDAQTRGGVSYLNFGSDYRTDFTVVVRAKVAAQMAETPEDLVGARVEVRGWIEMVNGPSIWLRNARALRVMG